jgi:TRAF3-interacting protein 1
MATMVEVQEVLGAVIKKPKLQEKVLERPPFRFLHDIVTEITNVTGFGAGLYSGVELDAKAIDGKEAKCDYLNKIIICTGFALNTTVDLNPGKVVAGKEPEKTWAWLVQLAKASTSGADFKACTQKTLASVGAGGGGGGESKTESAPAPVDAGESKVCSNSQDGKP